MGELGERGIWEHGGVKSIFDIRDIVYMVIQYCDDEALFKMAMLNKYLRAILLFDQSHRGKDYKIRILSFKVNRSYQNLDRVVGKIANGELIDTQALNNDTDQDGNRDLDLYVKTLALKYPTMVAANIKNKKCLSITKISLKPN